MAINVYLWKRTVWNGIFCPKNLDIALTAYILRRKKEEEKLHNTGHPLSLQMSDLGLN